MIASLKWTVRMGGSFPTLRIGFHSSRAMYLSQFKGTKENGYTLETLPNPYEDSMALVGRPYALKTNICDPDNILSDDTKDVLEGCLNELSEANLAKGAVAIVNKIASTDKYKVVEGGNNEKAIEIFTRNLHDLWGIGDKDTQNGLLLFLSVRDRAIFISTGSGIEGKLTKKVLRNIISEMKPALRQKNYDEALELALMQIEFTLKGVKLPQISQSSNQGDNGNKWSDRATRMMSDGMITFFLIFLCLAPSFLPNEDEKRLKVLTKCKEDLDRIYEVDTHSCPTCFHQYATNDHDNVVNKGEFRNRIALGTCRHAFCEKCIKETVKFSEASGTECLCGVCGESFDPTDLFRENLPVEDNVESSEKSSPISLANKEDSRSVAKRHENASTGDQSSSTSSSGDWGNWSSKGRYWNDQETSNRQEQYYRYRARQWRKKYKDTFHDDEDFAEDVENNVNKGREHGNEAIQRAQRRLAGETKNIQDKIRESRRSSGSSGSSNSSRGGGSSSSSGGGGGSW